jgi:hypothetical protein
MEESIFVPRSPEIMEEVFSQFFHHAYVIRCCNFLFPRSPLWKGLVLCVVFLGWVYWKVTWGIMRYNEGISANYIQRTEIFCLTSTGVLCASYVLLDTCFQLSLDIFKQGSCLKLISNYLYSLLSYDKA